MWLPCLIWRAAPWESKRLRRNWSGSGATTSKDQPCFPCCRHLARQYNNASLQPRRVSLDGYAPARLGSNGAMRVPLPGKWKTTRPEHKPVRISSTGSKAITIGNDCIPRSTSVPLSNIRSGVWLPKAYMPVFSQLKVVPSSIRGQDGLPQSVVSFG